MALSITYHNSELNDRWRLFAEEYIIDLNGTQAAIRAGYSKKTAQQIASRMLTNVLVRDYIHELIEKRSKSTEITAERVLKEMALIAYGNMKDFIEFDENGIRLKNQKDLTREQLGIISELTIEKSKKGGKTSSKIKLYAKDNALSNLFRHLGLFEKDNSQLGKDITVVIKKTT